MLPFSVPLAASLASYLTLKMEAVHSPETMVNFYQTTQSNIPERFLFSVDVVHIKMFSLLVHSNDENH
jgi:hypothetical protein